MSGVALAHDDVDNNFETLRRTLNDLIQDVDAITAGTLANVTPGNLKVDNISDGAVDTAQIADDAVTVDKLADNSVGAAQIIDGSLTLADLAGGGALVATTSDDGLMSSADKTKLDGVAASANNYSLPTADATTLGGVKIGTNLTMTNGVLSSANTVYTHPNHSGDVVSAADGATTIQPLAVQTGMIADLAVTGAKVAAGTITATNIAAGTITANELASGVTTSITTREVWYCKIHTSGRVDGFDVSHWTTTSNLQNYPSGENGTSPDGKTRWGGPGAAAQGTPGGIAHPWHLGASYHPTSIYTDANCPFEIFTANYYGYSVNVIVLRVPAGNGTWSLKGISYQKAQCTTEQDFTTLSNSGNTWIATQDAQYDWMVGTSTAYPNGSTSSGANGDRIVHFGGGYGSGGSSYTFGGLFERIG
tara:strand:+ start:1697 stop:2956 length:1260 start_codon:yes stop_codon:yes gene_type:complete